MYSHMNQHTIRTDSSKARTALELLNDALFVLTPYIVESTSRVTNPAFDEELNTRRYSVYMFNMNIISMQTRHSEQC